LQAGTVLRFATPQARVAVDLLDAALVAPAGAPFMPFQPEPPDLSQGVRINLYNKWGTNFPMWWQGSIAFRIVLHLVF